MPGRARNVKPLGSSRPPFTLRCCVVPRHRGAWGKPVSPNRPRSAMKITGTRTDLVELPADEPLPGAAENPNGKRPIVTVRVETDQGIEGVGVAYFGGALSRTLRHAIDQLGALCVGDDPQRVEAVQLKLKNGGGGAAGPGGLFYLALSVVRD